MQRGRHGQTPSLIMDTYIKYLDVRSSCKFARSILHLCPILFSSGDIERLRMQSAEGEAEKQALRERIDQLMRSQQELESRSTSLQLTVDRLTLALAKTEEEEQAFKEKVNLLSRVPGRIPKASTRFHLNDPTLGNHPQIQKLESSCTT